MDNQLNETTNEIDIADTAYENFVENDSSVSTNNEEIRNSDLSEEEIEKELNERLKKYIGDNYEEEISKYLDPDKFIELKIDESKLNKVGNFGIIDKETIELTITEINNEIYRLHEILCRKKDNIDTDSDVDEINIKKFIKNVLDIKYSMESLETSLDSIDIKKVLEDATNVIYPEYKIKGPSMILDNFYTYLENRIQNEKDFEFLIFELTNKKKVIDILENSNDRLFTHLSTKKYKINYSNFIIMMFDRIKLLLANLVGLEESDITIKKVENELIVLNILLIRYIYKKFDVSKNVIDKYLLRNFLIDMFSKRNEIFNKNADESLNKILILILKIVMKSRESL